MATRGVRGATTADRNDAANIGERTLKLIRILVELNGIEPEDLASATFSVSGDLDAEFPAMPVRSLPGWEEVPLLCAREIPVPGSLGGPDLASLAGPGLLDTTRLAGQPPPLALELALADPEALAAAIEGVCRPLRDLKSALRRADEAAVAGFFARASEIRGSFGR